MQYNTPPARASRSDMTTPVTRRPKRDYRPGNQKKKKKNKAIGVVPLLILFVAVLILTEGEGAEGFEAFGEIGCDALDVRRRRR